MGDVSASATRTINTTANGTSRAAAVDHSGKKPIASVTSVKYSSNHPPAKPGAFKL